MRTASQIKAVKHETPPKQTALRDFREKFGITQQDVCSEIHSNLNTYAAWETGKNFPGLAKAYQISKFFECSVYDIFPVDQVLGNDE